MSGPFEQYVEQATTAVIDAHYMPMDEVGRGFIADDLRAALEAVGPLIQEDARERMVAAAGAALEREGAGCAQAPTASREPEGKVLAALEKWYADMDDDDGPFAFNYSTGQLTAAPPESLKSLLETATKLGLDLGRKEAGEEIALAIERVMNDSTAGLADISGDRAVAIAREVSQR